MKRFTLLIVLTLAFCAGLHAQTFSLETGRQPVASLDGLWRFHTGDNPQWASPSLDDSAWPLLRSDKDWASQGYKGYGGFAWYRFRLAVPAGLDDVSLLLPPLMTSYQVFANGKQVGGFGGMPPHGVAYRTPPAAYRLHLGQSAEPREVTIALRVWHWPGWSSYFGGGPRQGGSLAGQSVLIDQQLQSLRDASVLSSGASYSMGLLELIAGIMAFLLFFIRRRETEYLWFALTEFTGAITFGLEVYSHFHPVPVLSIDELNEVLAVIGSLTYLLFLKKLLRGRRSLLFYMAIAAVVIPFLLYNMLLLQISLTIGAVDMANAVCLLAFLVWVFDLLVRQAKQGLPDARLLLAPVLLSAVWNPLQGALWAAFQLGWLKTDLHDFDLVMHPFPVSLAVCIEILFLIAMLAILSNRFMRSRREEQRMISELEAARSLQSLLVPAVAQQTPGFTVESVYLPASEVGGDFFHVHSANDGSLLIVVGDVSGKGLQAAMTVSAIIGALRSATFTRPAEVIDNLNRVLHGQIAGFVTCCAALISPQGNITIANAGHLSPYRNGKEIAIDAGLPIGLLQHIDCNESTAQLGIGDRLTFVSDGVVEARDAKGELFGFERTATLASRTAEFIAEAAQSFGQEDDITVLSVTLTAELQGATA